MEIDTNHPIDPTVRARVLEQLADIERRENVRILYACESGSRGWGFASPDSDYDVRFIFVRPLNQYLRLYPPRDVIEVAPGPVFDVNGWDLRKALLLLAKGNATLVEWLSSPIIYRAEKGFLAEMRNAGASVHRPERSFHHYVHMARGNYREYLQGEAFAIVDVPDVDLFVLGNVGGLEQVFINGAGAFVVQFTVGDADAMDLGFEQGTEHVHPQ